VPDDERPMRTTKESNTREDEVSDTWRAARDRARAEFVARFGEYVTKGYQPPMPVPSRLLAERAELRRVEVAALRAIDPACETQDDPPVVWRALVRMGGEPSGVLLDLPRASGRGKPGSRLVLAARSYDGAGPNGGEAHDYVTAFVRFRDGAGYERRTIGVAIHRAELRQVAAMLVSHADALDAGDAAER
jgi:hypothetical protein